MRAISTLIFFVTLAICYNLNADTLKLAADPWCPYNCNTDDSQQGFMIDAARTIFEQSSISVEYKNINWARAKADLNKGIFDAVVGMSKNDDFDQWVFPREELGVEQMCVYTDDPNWRYTSTEDLHDVLLGVINSYEYGSDTDNYISQNKEARKVISISGSNPLKRLIEMLRRDRIDALIENRYVMDHFLRHTSSTLRVAGCLSPPREVYIVFSKNNPKAEEYAEILSKGIIKLRTEGTLTKILAKYGVSDWKAP